MSGVGCWVLSAGGDKTRNEEMRNEKMRNEEMKKHRNVSGKHIIQRLRFFIDCVRQNYFTKTNKGAKRNTTFSPILVRGISRREIRQL